MPKGHGGVLPSIRVDSQRKRRALDRPTARTRLRGDAITPPTANAPARVQSPQHSTDGHLSVIASAAGSPKANFCRRFVCVTTALRRARWPLRCSRPRPWASGLSPRLPASIQRLFSTSELALPPPSALPASSSPLLASPATPAMAEGRRRFDSSPSSTATTR